MEPTREVASVDLRAVTRELAAIEDAHVEKAYLYPADLLRLKLRHYEQGRLELLAQVGDVKRLHLADPATVPDAPGRPPNFARMLRNRLEHGQVAGIRQLGFDRIVEVRFDVPDGTVRVVIELFGDGNVVAIGTDDVVVDCLRTVRLRSRTVVPGEPYEVPDQRVNPFALARAAFHEHMRESDADVVRTLATQLNLGGRYAEEMCARAGVEKGLPVADADASVFDAVYDAIADVDERLAAGAFEPTVYSDDAGVVDVSPIELHDRSDLDAERFETVSGAMDHYFRRLPERETGEVGEASDLDAERSRLQRIIDQQEQAIEASRDEAAALREQAELLYANYELIDEVLTEVRGAREAGYGWEEIETRLEQGAQAGMAAAAAVSGVDPEAGTVAVDLDGHAIELRVADGVERNADRLYREAKDVEDKIDGARAALEETRAELEALEAEPDHHDEDAPSEAAPGDWLERASIPIRRPEHWYEQFRWFHTADGFLVIGGRDATQNEAIIRKYAEPNDRVFHTQAHGGPMTILKATAPDESARAVDFPSTTLEQAAQFAVSYSSVWKEGRFAGDVYMVAPDQVSKSAESGEYLAGGGFAVRGDRTYFEDTPVGVAVGLACEPETRVIGGPPAAIEGRVATVDHVEPGRYAQGDVAKRLYRRWRERFADERFVRKVASPDRIQHFLPPGGSRIVED